MEYIQALQNLVQDYWVLSLCVGFFSTFIESFIPMLPLVALITANAALFGMLKGFLISWLGSVMGTICLFLIIYNKYYHISFKCILLNYINTFIYFSNKSIINSIVFLVIPFPT